MTTKPQTSWLIDAILFVGLSASFFPELTGVQAHQWLGLIGGALAAVHLALHWPWVRAVTRRFFGRTSGTSRTYLLLDGGILFGFASMIGTGLIISTWLDLNLGDHAAWSTLHILSSIGTLVMVLTKIALHWRWIAAVGRRLLEPAPSPAVQPVAGARGAVGRREFLSVMGLAGFAAAVALTNGAGGLLNTLLAEAEEGLDESADPIAAAESGTSVTLDSSSSTSTRAVALPEASLPQVSVQTETGDPVACSVACGRGCSFPGRCRKYTDSNANGLCDWGECA